MANNNETLNAEEVAAATITTEATPETGKKKLSKKAKIAIGTGIGVAIGFGIGTVILKCLKKNKDDEEILVVESAE